MSDYFSLQPFAFNNNNISLHDANSPGCYSPASKNELYHSPTTRQTPRNDLEKQLNQVAFKTGNEKVFEEDITSPFYVDVPIPNQEKPSSRKGSAVGLENETKDYFGDSLQDETHFVREYPTDILIDRFHKCKKIMKSLILYLKEVAFAQEQISRINIQLKGSIKFPFLTDLEEGSNKLVDPLLLTSPIKKPQPVPLVQQRKEINISTIPSPAEDNSIPFANVANAEETSASSGFLKFGSGSIQDIQVILKKYHLSLAAQQLKVSNDITTTLVPELSELRKELNIKLKDIKGLHGDFKTNMNDMLAKTKSLLNRYNTVVEIMNSKERGHETSKVNKNTKFEPKYDPYLLKLQLDIQLRKQLAEENYLKEAFINLQSSGMKLEKIIYSKIQSVLQRYSSLIDSEARLMIHNLRQELQKSILSRPPEVEWDHFVSHHPTCLLDWKSNDPIPKKRDISDIVYPNMKSPLAKCIKIGFLYYLMEAKENYEKAYFILTSNYLHKFNRDDFFGKNDDSHDEVQKSCIAGFVPIFSISLNDSKVTELTDTCFQISGKLTIPKLGSFTGRVEEGLHSSPENNCDGPKKSSSKSTFKRLLKNTNESKEDPSKDEQNKKSSEIKVLNITFKINESDHLTEDEIKELSKWHREIKALASFDSTSARSQYIQARLNKMHYRSKARTIQKSPSMDGKEVLDDELFDATNNPSNSTYTFPGRNTPRYIELPGQPIPLLSDQKFSPLSKVNTPAIDDDGNLITVSGHKYSANRQLCLPSSHTLPTTPASQRSLNTGYFESSPKFADKSITNANTNSMEDGHASTKYLAHRRNTSLTQSILSTDSQFTKEDLTRFSIKENPNANYFKEINNMDKSDFAEDGLRRADLITEHNLNRTGTDEWKNNINNNISKVVLNDKFQRNCPDISGSSGDGPILTEESNQDQGIQNIGFKKVYSTGSAGDSYLNKNEINPNSHGMRTHPILKHKKGLSLNALNGIVLPKQLNRTMSNPVTKQQESKQCNSIKLNQSIYF
ncbi:Rgc1p NDAI_0A04710 [Naumovozyma dairenensis CBS 421]|uniref:PH domain-containing protein n=1 Tax=Naumovozyma dairenensis (strain ATCC 10597 / BCRC 20456 / CBS 421 / NBRC 0211 / NRRL Y-12639) TaxID=1071378 RepID=G0W489_NAUDC|nr:hypothetical protein NDAI_0A04710 [Naumovozyma dairenensis CBS 421]CCD22627.1 hypothetical protein NDAI_0A04710 [Naumovozyma dairenensis CBS 421]